jgi:hypothetical protein
MKLRVFEVEYTDWDGSIELDRFTAEDEDHAVEKFYRSHGPKAVILELRYRGET